jgi:hypothetical protein
MFATANAGSVGGWVGILGVALFGTGAVVGLVQGLRRGPRLSIDDDGIHDRTLGVGVIAWSDIVSAAPYLVAKEPFIGLNLRDPAKYIQRAPPLKRRLARMHAASGMPPFSVNLVGLEGDPARVAQLIMSAVQANIGGASPPTWSSEESGDDTDREHSGNDSDDDADDVEPEPPAPRRVAQRALVLAALSCRSGIDVDAGNADAEAFRRNVVAWLASVGALAEAEPAERRLLEARLGTLDERHIVDAGWRAEGLAVLAWGLGRSELPSYQEMVDPRKVADALGFMEPAGETLLATATLRSHDEIEALAQRLFAVHWRLREFSLRPVAMDFVSTARTAWFGPLDVTGLELASGDLAIDGRPLSAVPEHRWRQCLSIAQERHQAANWLCGHESVYSEVSADT